MPVITTPLAGLTAPAVKVEIAFGNNALDALASLTWIDVSTYCLGFTTHMGRQHELNRVEASVADIRFDNRDRRFDPTNTSSPYSPYVVPMKRIRISATWNAITYRIFTGYIESWPLSWLTVTDSEVTVHCVDALGKVLGLKNLLTPYAVTVLSSTPSTYYRLEEAAGPLAGDSSGNARIGTFSGSPTFGQAGAFASSNAVLFNGSTNDLLSAPFAEQPQAPFWVGFALKTSGDAHFVRTTGNLKFGMSIISGQLRDSNGNPCSDASTYSDGAWHFYLISVTTSNTSAYIDGVSQGNVGSGFTGWLGPLVFGPGTTYPTESYTLDELAVYDGLAFGAAFGTAAIAQYAARTAWANDLSGARVGRLLDALGWPTADRNIEAGLSTLQAEPQPGNALTNLTDTATTENGLLFQGPDGKINFFQRSHLWTTAASTVSQATFGDGAGELPYILPGIAPVMDDLDLWNDVQVTRNGGVLQEAQDSASQTTYGLRSLSLTNLKSANDSDALARAQYDISRYKSPLTRVRSFTITPISDPTNLFPQALGRLLWDRITFKRRPVGGGPVYNQDSIIEGISHRYTKASNWETTFALSPGDANANQYFILDSSSQGVLNTNRLAY